MIVSKPPSDSSGEAKNGSYIIGTLNEILLVAILSSCLIYCTPYMHNIAHYKTLVIRDLCDFIFLGPMYEGKKASTVACSKENDERLFVIHTSDASASLLAFRCNSMHGYLCVYICMPRNENR